MSNLKQQLAQDRELRDEARALIDVDIAHAKALVSPANLRERTVPPASEKAQQLFQDTQDQALNNKGTIAAIAGAAVSAVILWFVREPLLDLIGQLTAADDDAGVEAVADDAAEDADAMK